MVGIRPISRRYGRNGSSKKAVGDDFRFSTVDWRFDRQWTLVFFPNPDSTPLQGSQQCLNQCDIRYPRRQ
jgi:hypothetical protein